MLVLYYFFGVVLMKLLEERIKKDGIVLDGGVLKVGSFLNHQMDVPFLDKLADEFYRLFKESGITKVLTVEASGIGIAALTALKFGVPMVFAKKSKSSNIGSDCYSAAVRSFTHGNTNNVIVEKQFLSTSDRILLIDDFLANGEALKGLIKLVSDAGATLVGSGIVIEKGFQGGGDELRKAGYRIESLAKIKSMHPLGGIDFE